LEGDMFRRSAVRMLRRIGHHSYQLSTAMIE
ncbi:hypothetical protein ABH944_009139, partial [Caballeronia udeis]